MYSVRKLRKLPVHSLCSLFMLLVRKTFFQISLLLPAGEGGAAAPDEGRVRASKKRHLILRDGRFLLGSDFTLPHKMLLPIRRLAERLQTLAKGVHLQLVHERHGTGSPDILQT